MRRKGQAGLEYLANYGFMILALLVVFVLLWQLKVFTFATPTKLATGFTQFSVIDFALSGNDSSTTANRFQLAMQIIDESVATVTKVEVTRGGAPCGQSNYSNTIRTRPGRPLLVAGYLDPDCTVDDPDSYEYALKIYYTPKSGIEHTDQGAIKGRFERLGELIIEYPWHATGDGSDIMSMENGNALASYAGVCPAQPPADSALPLAQSNYITWSKPGDCNTAGLTGVGFGTASCQLNGSALAHGWLASTVYVSLAYADKNLLLGGPANYTDGNGVHTGYICVNDNFYFFVNNQSVFSGGTTGVVGSEVMRYCDGSTCADSDGWCIPPVDLSSTEAFNYGQNNSISVLVEDYCTSGGIRIPEYYFV